MRRTCRWMVRTVEACALAAGFLLCAADQVVSHETIKQATAQQELQQLFLLLKEEALLDQPPSR